MENINVLPSPASSPSPNILEITAQPSRKRQRSHSMLSDASTSSLKRAVSDDIPPGLRSPRADKLSSLSLTDPAQDIDAYMAEQGEADIPTAISIPSSVSHDTSGCPSVPPAEKLSIVNWGKSKEMEIGETWYLIARDWWKRWEKACTGLADKGGLMTENDLGPVDNSRLLDQYGNLQPSLVEGVDVEYVPEETWQLLVDWYGIPPHSLPRQIIARGALKQASLELHPPHFRVARLDPEGERNSNVDQSSLVVISSGESVATLHAKLADAVVPNSPNRPVFRIWSLTSVEGSFDLNQITAQSILDAKARLLESSTKTLEEADMESGDAFVVELMDEQQRWIMDRYTVNPKSRDETPAPIFRSSEGFFNRMLLGTSSDMRLNKAENSLKKAVAGTSRNLTSFSSSLKMQIPGSLGLGNMGNTCFMNSALQCLAHNKELTDYFLSGVFEEELNPDNPLGMHGAIAVAFGALLQRIWATTGTSSSYSPREFKQQLQRFAPQFSGYQQHDSQELVAFLLDGLHEDLNRVLKKPYVQKPDWEGGSDFELVQLANKSWEGYMLRNDSVIVDLFQGQYQSTLVCPECEKVSITFDPFMYLTLPLPVKKKWKHTIKYVPWDNGKPHLKVPVEVDGDSTFKAVRTLLGRWMDVPFSNLLFLEIFSHRFYKSLDDNVPVGDMLDNDTIFCFELPCHARQSKTYKPQADEPFILPLYFCEANPPTRTSFVSTRSLSLFGTPIIVVLDKIQAKDFNDIYDQVVARLERWTRSAQHLYTWEATEDPETQENGDMLAPNGLIPEESDIVDQKSMIMEDHKVSTNVVDSEPIRVGTKKDIFNLKLQTDHKQWGTTQGYYSATSKWETWKERTENTEEGQPLILDDDALYCEFDENMKVFYFGDSHTQWDHALWDTWEEFIHPEYEAARKANAEKMHRGLSLQDCLEEFTKEEKLGEDDLWYCPQCKKHQQATKKFDLWNVPDILVVHLKRFSNSRTLRDKIDAFVDFPVEGLDLGSMVREREVAKKLVEQSIDISQLNLTNLDEPLIYDLFGVDEHMGGLGGGHYRAYALNHMNGKWYHFDDSFVTPANPADAVNANAYLLFYRRRTDTPLGRKTHDIIEAARSKMRQEFEVTNKANQGETSMAVDTQLPTPPDESRPELQFSPADTDDAHSNIPLRRRRDYWHRRSFDGSPGPSPPVDDYSLYEPQDDLPFSESLDNPLSLSSSRFDFPDPSSKASPTSSNEALADQDDFDDGQDSSNSPHQLYETPEAGSSSSSTSLSSPHQDAKPERWP
ncbi:hypothetical protein AX17_002705 [Amanita inopinata Kibby_2008]|nr:hypothetical protein AX17_002705 [Amanita inopinata Kibby_2008]